MKFKFLFITALLLTTFTQVLAQRGGWDMDPGQRAKTQAAMMKDSLSLSEAQASKVEEVLLKYAKQMSDVRNGDSGGDWTAMREKIMVIREAQNKELKTMLTTEQYDKWTKIQEAQRGNRGGPGGNRSGQPKEKNG